jgi:hypothetical protein
MAVDGKMICTQAQRVIYSEVLLFHETSINVKEQFQQNDFCVMYDVYIFIFRSMGMSMFNADL